MVARSADACFQRNVTHELLSLIEAGDTRCGQQAGEGTA